MLGRLVLEWAQRNPRINQTIAESPVAQRFASRFIAGEQPGDAIEVALGLQSTGRVASLSYLGPPVLTESDSADVVKQYQAAAAQAADRLVSAELAVKPSVLGAGLPVTERGDLVFGNAAAICSAAEAAGMTVTIDMEEAETTDATLELLTRLRADYPWVGVALQADLVRTESDCRELAVPGSRVRLCKGAYRPPFGAFESRQEIDLSFVRCLKVLLAGSGYPMIATHDPTMIEIARSLIVRNGRSPETYEFQMLRGIRPDEQMTLVGAGRTVRVYVPYGPDWRPWVMRRLIERPANLALFARSMLAGG